jgi:Rhs element Vgr protein
MPSLSPAGTITHPNTDLTTFSIKVNGELLPGTYGIVTVDLSREINRVPTASIVLLDGDAARQNFEISSDGQLAPGNDIEIEGGYSRNVTTLFKGIITQQRIRIKRRGESLLYIEAQDPVFRMTLDRKSKYFFDMTDDSLFSEIAGQYSDVRPEIESTSITHSEIVQYQVSDWDFIVARAEKLGMVCMAQDGRLIIKKPDLAQAPVLTVAYGTGLLDVDLELDSRAQFQAVTASAWDQANQEVISVDVDDVPAPSQGNQDGAEIAGVGEVENYNLRHTGGLKQEELDAWANAQMTKSRFSKIRGTVRVQGSETLTPGVMIELGGLGDRFNGAAYVSGVRHFLGDGDWVTTVQVGLDPQWHHEKFAITTPSASGFNPGIHGLQIGVVTQIHDDPEGEERIQVRLPIINPAEVGIWARLAMLDAGQERGTVFRPEVGDEVIVGFLNDDPHDPIVLGGVHSSNKPWPISATEENHEKGIVTRSGMKILFNDDHPSITIETPKGNKMVIHDDEGHILLEDESGNTLKLDSSGITFDSSRDVVLKATGDLTLEGMNVNLKASAAFKAEGSASASLESSGTTTVRGSLVNIN